MRSRLSSRKPRRWMSGGDEVLTELAACRSPPRKRFVVWWRLWRSATRRRSAKRDHGAGTWASRQAPQSGSAERADAGWAGVTARRSTAIRRRRGSRSSGNSGETSLSILGRDLTRRRARRGRFRRRNTNGGSRLRSTRSIRSAADGVIARPAYTAESAGNTWYSLRCCREEFRPAPEQYLPQGRSCMRNAMRAGRCATRRKTWSVGYIADRRSRPRSLLLPPRLAGVVHEGRRWCGQNRDRHGAAAAQHRADPTAMLRRAESRRLLTSGTTSARSPLASRRAGNKKKRAGDSRI